jgi:branched-chain amino acid transport system ATP-binding protein
MEKGSIRFSGLTSELGTSEILKSVFVGADSPTAKGAPSGLAAAAAKRAEQRQLEAVAAPEADSGDRVLLQATGLQKRFGAVTAVSDLTLGVRNGEVLGIIGANGAGKTTAFDIISGFLQPDAGQLVFKGQDVTDASPPERAALGFGRTFQDVRMMPSLTTAESLAVALERHISVRDPIACLFNLGATQQSEARVKSRVDELIGTFGLERWRDVFVSDLSTGTRRILEIACSAAHQPHILLLDEPTSGLAQREAEAMAGVLLDLKERISATILIVEHDVPLVSAVSDRLVCMHLGGVVARGLPDAVLSDPKVVASYLGADEATIFRSGAGPSPGKGVSRRRLRSPTLTTGEFAALRGISQGTVLRHIHQGRVAATRNGKGWVIPASELERDLTLTARPS